DACEQSNRRDPSRPRAGPAPARGRPRGRPRRPAGAPRSATRHARRCRGRGRPKRGRVDPAPRADGDDRRPLDARRRARHDPRADRAGTPDPGARAHRARRRALPPPRARGGRVGLRQKVQRAHRPARGHPNSCPRRSLPRPRGHEDPSARVSRAGAQRRRARPGRGPLGAGTGGGQADGRGIHGPAGGGDPLALAEDDRDVPPPRDAEVGPDEPRRAGSLCIAGRHPGRRRTV
ncbi:MAG: Regulatory protein, LuxR:Response regulator receiver, partial [uncultured Thermomicrobiales bacterium]